MSDWRKASKSFQKALLSSSKEYNKVAANLITAGIEIFLQNTEASKWEIPYYTGNLLDSIGARVLIGNRLVSYRTLVDVTYTQHAMKPQHMKGVYPIWGELELMKRIQRPSRRTRRGVVSQLIVGVPYAEEVDKTHNYFQPLSDSFSYQMERSLAVLGRLKHLADV